MKKHSFYLKYILCLLLLVTIKAEAQVTVTSSDSINCGTTCTTLTAHLNGDSPTDAGVTSDDIYSGVHSIGFSFSFYGIAYTQCLLGANGTIDFNLSEAGAYDEWTIDAPLLGNPSKLNNICGPWVDIDIFYSLPYAGSETYSTSGVAPYRKFSVTWCGCKMYSCGTQRTTTQIILYETTNIIEVHIAQKPICTSWNPSSPPGAGGRAIIGVQNATGTAATTAPGRDFPSIWANPPSEAWRFTPSASGSSYTVASIPFAPIPLASSALYWYNVTTGAYMGTGTTMVVCPTTTTTYKAGALGCGADTSFGYYTVVPSPVGPTVTFAVTNPTLCGVCDGKIVLSGLTPGLSDTVRYDLGGVPQPPIVAIVSGSGTITLSGLCPGVYDNIIVKQLTCYSSPVGPATLTYPPISISSVTTTDPTLCGICDGTITLNGLYASHAYTISYNFNGSPRPPLSVTTNAAGSVTITGLCAGTYDNIVASFGVCVTPAVGPYILNNPPISISSVTTTDPSFCGVCDGTMVLNGLYASHVFTVNYDLNGVAQPSFVTTSSATGTITLTGLCAGTYTNIKASFGDCVTPPVGPYTLNNPPTPPLYIDSSVNPTACGVCNGSIYIRAITPYSTDTVNYSVNGFPQTPVIVIANADSTVILPGLCAGTYSGFTIKFGDCLYNVTGSVTLRTDSIQASFNDIVHFGCNGDTVIFHDSSYFFNPVTSSPGVGLYHIWDFGDGYSDTSLNPTHIYHTQGTFTVTLVSTNHYCVDSFQKVISLIHPLSAAFTENPAIICQGDTVAFTNATIFSPPVKYMWDFGDGAKDTATNPLHSYKNMGTYTVTLIATDWVPCSDTTTRTVDVDTMSGLVMSVTDTVICQGTYMTFEGLFAGEGNIGISWNFGDGNSMVNTNPITHAYGSTGTFAVTVNVLYRACPNLTTTRNIVVLPQPHIDLGQDTSICPGGESFILGDRYNTNSGMTQWLWNTGATTPTIAITEPGYYYATVSINNCSATDTVWVENDCYMSIPNVFTPNGDGVNDYFFPRQLLSKGLIAFKMNIYNRWGQEIFTTDKIDGRGWDGNFNDIPQPEGVYVYVIDGTFKDGQKERHQGNVTLLR